MMGTERLVAVLLLAGLAGWANKVWVKADGTESNFTQDHYECERDMRQSGYYGTGLTGAINAQGFFNQCMQARGYALIDADAGGVPTASSAVASTPTDTTDYGACFRATGSFTGCGGKGGNPAAPAPVPAPSPASTDYRACFKKTGTFTGCGT